MPKRKNDAPADPDRLVRQSAGDYRTGDERFTVRQADVGWFLVDSEQSNEFGQELIHGPYPTLKAVREAIPGARDRKILPFPTPAKGAKREGTKSKPKAEPPPPPPTWIDRLPAAEGRAVRKLIRELEREGIGDAEELVKRDRDGLLPAVASRRIERAIAAILEDVPSEDRAATKAVVGRVVELLSSEGTAARDLPGWTLVEVGPGDDPPPHRRIDLRD